jgi:RHS repeat-associated protein
VWFTDDDAGSGFTSDANEIIYCGYRSDPETELYYVRNRTYPPTLGRWLQRDPVGYVGGVNLYEYVGGRAVNKADPNGTQPIIIGAGIGFAVACGISAAFAWWEGKTACQVTRACVCSGLSGAILGGAVSVAPEIALVDRCLLGGNRRTGR